MGKLPPIALLRQRYNYDPDTGDLTWRIRPRANGVLGGPVGTVEFGYRKTTVQGRSIRVHRIAWAIHHGAWPPAQIDHINGVRHDNRICNLRLATSVQNNANKPHRNKHGFKGVTYLPRARSRPYMANIGHGRQNKFLGAYSTAEDAAQAYDTAASEMHGEFARLNFPPQDRESAR